jgi:ATP adenylyltransferase
MDREGLLGFYNGGDRRGASQRHKHLQVVRLPLAPQADIPVVRAPRPKGGLPFRHVFARLDRFDAATLSARYAGCCARPGANRDPIISS